VILAGGAGKRFNGLIKPAIAIDGETIISRMIDVISDIFSEIIIVQKLRLCLKSTNTAELLMISF